jgi:hypothetical protein
MNNDKNSRKPLAKASTKATEAAKGKPAQPAAAEIFSNPRQDGKKPITAGSAPHIAAQRGRGKVTEPDASTEETESDEDCRPVEPQTNRRQSLIPKKAVYDGTPAMASPLHKNAEKQGGNERQNPTKPAEYLG